MTIDPNSDRHPSPYRLDSLRRTKVVTGMNVPEDRKDAASLIFQRELEVLQSRVYERKYPAMKMAEGAIVPMRGTIPRGAKSASYKMISHFGVAKWFTTGSMKDLAMAGVAAERKEYTVHEFGEAYGFEVWELEQAAFAGVPLSEQTIMAADRANALFVNRVGLFGDVEKNLQGFLNHQNMPVMSARAGAGTATRWSTLGSTAKTALECQQDIAFAKRTMRSLTGLVHQPTHCWLPPSFWERTVNLVIPGTAVTLKSFLSETYPDIRFEELLELETASSTGGPSIMFASMMGPEDMWVEMPMRSEPHGPFEDGLRTNFILRSSTGGFITPYPLALLRLDFAAT
jgi:hypothetical protein